MTATSEAYHPPASNFKFSFQYNIDRFRVCDMFLLQNARRQRAFLVRVQNRDSLLDNNGAVIQFLIDEMHRASRDLDAKSKSLLLCLKTWERRQQGRMDVQNLLRKLLHEPWREQAHVARQADEIDFIFSQRFYNCAVVLLAWLSLRRDYLRGYS